MKTVLVPLQVEPGNNQANMAQMAEWVEKLHSDVDLMVFPQIEVGLAASPGVGNAIANLHVQSDMVSAMAARRCVYISTGFWQASEDDHFAMLMLADRTGQMDARSQKLALEPNLDGIEPTLLTARIRGRKVSFNLSDDVFEQNLQKSIKLLSVQVVILPVYLAASAGEVQEEEGALPASLRELMQQASLFARQTGVHVLAVNSISQENLEIAPCGGGFVCDPSGEIVAERFVRDTNPLFYEIS